MESISTTLAIASGSPATYDASGFAALTWNEVAQVATIGQMGDSHADIALPADLKTGRVKHLTGPSDGGEIPVAVNVEDFAGAGQDMVRTANGARTDYSIRVTRASGKVEYTVGRIVSYRHNEATATAFEGVTFTIRANGGVVVVEPT